MTHKGRYLRELHFVSWTWSISNTLYTPTHLLCHIAIASNYIRPISFVWWLGKINVGLPMKLVEYQRFRSQVFTMNSVFTLPLSALSTFFEKAFGLTSISCRYKILYSDWCSRVCFLIEQILAQPKAWVTTTRTFL